MAAKFRGYKPQPPEQAQLSPALQQKLQQAIALHQRGVITQAQVMYDEILKVQPKHFDALHLLGVCMYQTGQLEKAIETIAAAIRLNSNHPSAYNNHGEALKDLKRLDEALTSYDKAISLKPNYAEAYNNRGNALVTLKRLDEALASYDTAISLKPDYAQAYNNRGNALAHLNRLDEALASYDIAISLTPDYADAYNNRGNALAHLKRLDEALASYDTATSLTPDYAEAYYNRGNALADLKRLDEALASYDTAISLTPDYAEAYNNRGNVLADLKRLDEALASYDIAIKIKPDNEWVEGQRFHTAMKLCSWTSFFIHRESLSNYLNLRARASTPFPILGLIDSPYLQRCSAENYADSKHPLTSTIMPSTRRVREDKVRVGYYSADFHNHATLFLTAELFEQHNSIEYELHGFSFGPTKNDQMRQRVSSLFSSFQEVKDKSETEVAALSRELGIDIAVDLKGYTTDSRTGLFSKRCAPIQVSYLGYPGTMGTDYHDYIIADHTLIPPECQQYYSEKVVYLPHSYQVNDSKRRISDRVFSRRELGLPDAGFVYCCFNNNWKILPEVYDVWMRLLKAVDGSVLWLIEDNPTAAKNLRKEAADRGVDPQKIVFAQRMPLDDHLARHRCADLFLDTLPYNAHTTASDALWAGLPVLTQIGESFAARVAASLLNAMDLPELITHSREEYEAKALELALNPDKLAAVKVSVAASRKTTPLFDGKLFARHIEASYSEMIRRHDAGLKPANIEVSKDGVATSPDK